jgi:ABC-type multidrug transport system fused ATPase/permease subunit
LATLPKLIIEWLLILSIVLFIGIVAFDGDNYSYLITTLGIFLAAAFRLMPSTTRLLNAFQGINFYRNVVKTLKEEILFFDNNNFSIKKSTGDLSFNKKIKIHNLSFKYPDKEKNILTNINFEINKKEKIGIMGESGSGKTTLINMILGLLQPNTGNIEVDGKEINSNLTKWHSYIGYVPQSTFLSDSSIKNNIAFGENDEIIKKDNIYDSIKNAGLEKFVKGLKNGIDTNVGELGEKISGGERQRIGIARSLYRNPSLLILDEFTSSLDNENEQLILTEIFEKISNITVILVSHRESTLKRCSRILRLKNNEIRVS